MFFGVRVLRAIQRGTQALLSSSSTCNARELQGVTFEFGGNTVELGSGLTAAELDTGIPPTY